MYRNQRRRRPPKVRLETVDELVAEARQTLTEAGRAAYPAERWLSPCRLLTPYCLPRAEDYDRVALEIFVAAMLAQGWAWRREGDELVLEVPGWQPPAPREVAVQPGLFSD